MTIPSIPVFFCFVGTIIWIITAGPTRAWFAEFGRLVFFAALLAALLGVVGKSLF